MRHDQLEHRFVEVFPDRLDPGLLYISMEYGSATHACCCGCGEEVVTPFTPTDWRMIYDGETVSLWPSIGNWTLPCRSHYVIERGRVIEATPWTEEEIAYERERDRAAKAQYYCAPASPDATEMEFGPSDDAAVVEGSTWKSFIGWVSRLAR
ncbi:MAG: hypothetical protein JWR80_513 [Bradyrhizobium sp.]|nr:hypothetical protein [Bradyrhizobium sp.]